MARLEKTALERECRISDQALVLEASFNIQAPTFVDGESTNPLGLYSSLCTRPKIKSKTSGLKKFVDMYDDMLI